MSTRTFILDFLWDRENCPGEEIYTRVRKITIFYKIDSMDFPSESHISHVFDRCVRWAYICVHCVSQKVWVWATVVCVCSWMCKRQGWKRNLKAALSICFLHHCGGITLSIVGSLGISSVCNISLIHTSLWALPSRETQSPPWHCADPAHPLRLSPVWYHGSVRSTRDVKMSDSRL